MKASQKTALAELLCLQAGNIVGNWQLILKARPELQGITPDEAGQVISQWLKYLPGKTRRDPRLPLPK